MTYAWVLVLGSVMLAGCGPGVESSGYTLAVSRRADIAEPPRVWIVDSEGDGEHLVPTSSSADDRQQALGWAPDGSALYVAQGVLVAYADERLVEFPWPESGRHFLAGTTTASITPGGELFVVSEVDSGALPGINPPPGEAGLFLADPAALRVTAVDGAGSYGRLSAGAGPMAMVSRVTYHYAPQGEDEGSGDSYEYRSSWEIVRDGAMTTVDRPEGASGVLSTTAEHIAWHTDDSTTITSLAGEVLHTIDHGAQQVHWSAESRLLAGWNAERVWIYELDGRVTEILERPGVERLAWAPAHDRLLLEVHCDDWMQLHVVAERADIVLETECTERTFGAWAPDAEALALDLRRTPEEPTRRFQVLAVDGQDGPVLEGQVQSFRPEPR